LVSTTTNIPLILLLRLLRNEPKQRQRCESLPSFFHLQFKSLSLKSRLHHTSQRYNHTIHVSNFRFLLFHHYRCFHFMTFIARVLQKLVSMVRAPNPQHLEATTPLIVSHVFAIFFVFYIYKFGSIPCTKTAKCITFGVFIILMNFSSEIVIIRLILFFL